MKNYLFLPIQQQTVCPSSIPQPFVVLIDQKNNLPFLESLFMFIFGSIALLAKIQAQKCANLTIDAIFSCQMSFTYNSSVNECLFDSCFTQSPGNPQNSSNWANCYTLCCPGFVIPNESSLNSVNPCYLQYNTTPQVNLRVFQMVYIIGGIIATVLFMICIVLPCCTEYQSMLNSRKCLFHKIWTALWNKQSQIQSLKQQKSLEVYKQQIGQRLNKLQIQNLVSQPAKNLKKDESQSALTHVCSNCQISRPDCKLSCGHFYHNRCLTKANDDNLICKVCNKKVAFPVYSYCRNCCKNFEFKHQKPEAGYQYTCIGCLLL